MFRVLRERIRQGHRTSKYPLELPVLPDWFRGRPVVNASKCPDGCQECVAACPTDAITRKGPRSLQIDLGRCLFCTDCVQACPVGAIHYTQEYRLAANNREDLVVSGEGHRLALALEEKTRQLFGRSLKLRQVSAAGCNGCEADVNVLNTVVFDLSRFGVQFVASPRHADGLLITGPVSQNMKYALGVAYECIPSPKIVIAVGACAISGGPYIDHAEVNNGAAGLVPVDLFIPGCPPHPWTILDGILRLLGRLEDNPPRPVPVPATTLAPDSLRPAPVPA
jgi:Ni,Fe-hydrogenase III small subunit/Pyruvate/2-oxoacid:ferredoxin oxidoreductase delta subunit